MIEEFCASQLSTTCLCGNPKPLGNYACAICWRQVPEEIKKALSSASFKDKAALVERIDAIATCRNPDYIEGMKSTRYSFPLRRTAEPLNSLPMREPRSENTQTELSPVQYFQGLNRIPTDSQALL